ncbi:hypothetical protein, partial [Bacteroides sp.]
MVVLIYKSLLLEGMPECRMACGWHTSASFTVLTTMRAILFCPIVPIEAGGGCDGRDEKPYQTLKRAH